MQAGDMTTPPPCAFSPPPLQLRWDACKLAIQQLNYEGSRLRDAVNSLLPLLP